jgi:hypothetical protein
MIGVKVQRERGAEGKGTKVEIQARLNEGANVGIKVADKLIIKIPVREKLAG